MKKTSLAKGRGCPSLFVSEDGSDLECIFSDPKHADLRQSEHFVRWTDKQEKKT